MRKYITDIGAKEDISNVMTYQNFTQNTQVEINKELTEILRKENEKRDERVMNFTSIQKYARFTSLMAKLYFKILHVYDNEASDKALKSKRLCESLFFIARNCPK